VKTAAYTILPYLDRPGTVFTNAGASGAVVFTLPTPNKALVGWWYEFIGVVDQVITVQPPVADTLISFNDLDLDSVSTGASGQRIGAVMRVLCVSLTATTFAWVLEGATNGVTYALVD
jgi:hypothetical protein